MAIVLTIVLTIIGLALVGLGALWAIAYVYGHPSYPLKNPGVFRRHSP